MRAEVKRADAAPEFETAERCAIAEVANDEGDEGLSIARARVAPGVTTAWHRLIGVEERYIIISGEGRVEVGEQLSVVVGAGDVVRIPAATPQRIANTGAVDLLFYAICTPRFWPGCYQGLEE